MGEDLNARLKIALAARNPQAHGKVHVVDICHQNAVGTPPNVPTKKTLRWWERMPIKYAFSLLPVRNKLEMLMGSNMVSLTDRDYMMYLQKRLLTDHERFINKRIAVRKAEEMERVKNLVLSGRIPLDEAPMELANHPVMLITQYCKNVLAERRAKIHSLQPYIPKYLYWDDTPDPPSGLSIQRGHRFRLGKESLYVPPDHFLGKAKKKKKVSDGSEEEEVDEEVEEEEEITENSYMLPAEVFDELHYEAPEVKELRLAETVSEMYSAGDGILGVIAIEEESLLSTSGSTLEI